MGLQGLLFLVSLLVIAWIDNCRAFTAPPIIMRKDMSSDWTTITCRFKHNNNPSQKPSSLGINPPQPSTRPKWAFSMGEDAPFDPTSPDDLIARAKTLVATDLGILDGGRLLDDDFIWIGASNYGEVLSKADYLAAAKFFQLRYDQSAVSTTFACMRVSV